MGGDYSRDTFDALRDYAATLLQQGRPVTDADWNELTRTLMRRVRAGTVDTIGRATVPRETQTGFEIQIGGPGGLGIGRGRMYLSGMLIECHGRIDPFAGPAGRPVLDRSRLVSGRPAGVLDELISPPAGDFLSYTQQPYWPTPEPLPGAGRHLAYAVGWERETTAFQAPETLEPALGGIDSTTRIQNVWQVRLSPTAPNTGCTTPDAQIGSPWDTRIAPSTARLSTDTIAVDDPENPCLVPPTDGYAGLENQLYRIELHTVGATQSHARFKFSRENASVAASVEAIGPSAAGITRVTVSRIGRDRLLAFREGDWVEITDDRREFDHHSGEMLRVTAVHAETREIELEGDIPPDLIPTGGGDTPAARHTRMIRWDQRGVIRRETGETLADLDAAGSDGLIPVPDPGVRVILESGIVVAFDTAPGPGRFREMDYWRFAARTAGTQIQRLRRAPPDGIHRHYARLAVLDMPTTRVADCRVFWPPESAPVEAGEGCFCTTCVTPESHASGALTIQAAIDQLPQDGGTVCLAAGPYALGGPVIIAGRTGVALRGQGGRTILSFQGHGGAIRISRCIDVVVERLSVIAEIGESAAAAPPPVAGVHAVNSALVSLSRLTTIVTGGSGRTDHGIGFAGVCLGAKVVECLAAAPVALGALTDRDDKDHASFFICAELRAADNILIGRQAAVQFDGLALNLASADFSRNLMLGEATGLRLAWYDIRIAATSIVSNTILAQRRSAIELAATNARVQDNEISGGDEAGHGVHLVSGLAPEPGGDTQIIGNRIRDLGGAGVMVDAPIASLLVKRNVIRRCGAWGVAISPGATVGWLAIDNNVIEDIARASGEGAAIIVIGVQAGLVVGNRLQGVGRAEDTDGRYAGIALRSFGSLEVASNHLAGIGPMATKEPATGIFARGLYGLLTLRSNHVVGTSERENSGRNWAAIQIGRAIDGGFQPAEESTVAGEPLFRDFDDQLSELVVDGARLELSTSKLVVIDPAWLEPQTMIEGSQVRHDGMTIRPLVSVLGGPDASCIFTGNQIRHRGDAEAPALAVIEAGRIVAANNVVRRDNERVAVLLDTLDKGQATVMGNLTFGEIVLRPDGLKPPFKALNLVGP